MEENCQKITTAQTAGMNNRKFCFDVPCLDLSWCYVGVWHCKLRQLCICTWGMGRSIVVSTADSGSRDRRFESRCHSFLCGGLWQDLVIPCVWDTTVIACRWGLQSHVSERAKMRLFRVGSQIQLWRDRLQFPPLWWSWTICGHGCWRNRGLAPIKVPPPSFRSRTQ